ncbi:hypothetical protein M0R19_01765 [Candidatus Pacearchaeota archaeon]|nr:hypothetical protein [Candidatus Pacearchaeota archaeon]
MTDPTLVKYIQDSLSRKVPLEEIKKVLLEKGWQELAINEAINEINQQAQPPVQPQQQIQPQPQPQQPVQQPAIKPQPLPQQSSIQQPKTTSEKKPFEPNIIMIASISVAALVLIIILLVIFIPKGNISDEQLSQGTIVDLKENNDIKFNLDEEEHRILINSIQGNSVDFTIYSTPISASLKIGETKKFDVDSDNFFDLSIKLNGITDDKADLYIKEINEAVCTEDWECGNWSSCINLNQTRTCTDVNACGTEKNKPTEEQECIDLSCAGQGGIICTANQNCSALTINASDGSCCLGNCTALNTTNVSAVVLPISCDDIDCLIEASENCTLANLTYAFSFSNSTWIQDINYTYRIDGFDTEDKCKFYSKIKNIKGNYTADYWVTLLAVPYTKEEIDTFIDGVEDALKGDSGTCRFLEVNLTNYLTQIKDDNYELTEDEIVNFGCTGTLYP